MKWRALLVLAAAQFVMVIDTSVMNVSISQLVDDFDTQVTTIQGVITFYSLVMAAAMITGGKLGDRLGRRRAFVIGIGIYGSGSFITAISQSIPMLVLGWSVLEGLGAALVLPALVALVAGNYEGPDRARAYGIVGGVAGAAVAVGPIVGGWVTSNLTWRVVFLAEVVIVIAIILAKGSIRDAGSADPDAKIDLVGSLLSGSGLAIIVYGVLQSSEWGWLAPHNSPAEPFGFSITPFVIGAGLVLLWLFAQWQRRREARGEQVLVHLDLLGLAPLRAALATLLGQQLVLLGVFFVIPLYLQIVLGFDAFETGLRLLPVSVTLLAGSFAGAGLAERVGARTTVRIGVLAIAAGGFVLMSAVEPELEGAVFALALAILGAGMGLLVSQIGNIVQSSVEADARGEAGGLQFTAQNLGGALGTALIGSVVIGALAASILSGVGADDRLSETTKEQVGVALEQGVSFVPSNQVAAGVAEAGVPPDEAEALVEEYDESSLQALRAGILAAALIALGIYPFTRNLPGRPSDTLAVRAQAA